MAGFACNFISILPRSFCLRTSKENSKGAKPEEKTLVLAGSRRNSRASKTMPRGHCGYVGYPTSG